MKRIENAIFYDGVLPFGKKVLVGNKDYGRDYDVLIKNISITGSFNSSTQYGAYSKLAFGIETDENPCVLPGYYKEIDPRALHSYNSYEQNYRWFRTLPAMLYNNGGISDLGLWQGATDKRRMLPIPDPYLFTLAPKKESYDFVYKFTNPDTTVQWKNSKDDTNAPRNPYIRLNNGDMYYIDIQAKILELIAKHPNKNLQVVHVALAAKSTIAGASNDFRVGFNSAKNSVGGEAIATTSGLFNSNYEFINGYISKVSSYPTNEQLKNIFKYLYIYNNTSKPIDVYGISIKLIFEDDVWFESAPFNLPFGVTSAMCQSDFDTTNITIQSKCLWWNAVGNSSLGGYIKPNLKIALSSNAGKTWSEWFEFNSTVYRLYLQQMPKTCNLTAKIKFDGVLISGTINNYLQNITTVCDVSSLNQSTQEKVFNVLFEEENPFPTKTSTYEYALMLGSYNLGKPKQYSTGFYSEGYTEPMFRCLNNTEVMQIAYNPGTTTDLFYNTNIPLSKDEQFYMFLMGKKTYTWQDNGESAASVKKSLCFSEELDYPYPGYVAPRLLITGYKIYKE